MKRFLAILLLVSGCAVRFQTHPFAIEAGLLYSRITNCTAQDIPPPLVPNEAPLKMSAEGDKTNCTTLEVGAKSYADSISAIGIALMGILAKIALF